MSCASCFVCTLIYPLHTPERWRARTAQDPNTQHRLPVTPWRAVARAVFRLLSVQHPKGPQNTEPGRQLQSTGTIFLPGPCHSRKTGWEYLSPCEALGSTPSKPTPVFYGVSQSVGHGALASEAGTKHILLPKPNFVISIPDVSLPPGIAPPRSLPGRVLSPK